MNRKAWAVTAITLFIISLFSTVSFFAHGQQSSPTLAATIQTLVSNINFTSDLDAAYMGLSFNVVTVQSFQNLIDSLPSSDWSTILYWYAVVDKFNLVNQTTIERALDAATMLPNGLPEETSDIFSHPCFQVYDRYLIYGYYWANKYQYDLAKWNLTQAYISYDQAVNYSIINYYRPPLWIYGDGTAMPYSGRYYDETGESLDGYLEFYQFGVTQALSRAESLWDSENLWYWNGSYYGYTGVNGLYECEAGDFEQIIWKLYNYNSSIPNTQNLLTDTNTRYLDSLWNSPQWLDYVIQHANSNPQRRLENTLIAWQSIIGTYSLLSPSAQLKVQDLLNGTAYGMVNGDSEVAPAWSLLSNSQANLYDPTTGLYRMRSDAGVSSDATALAANLLMDLGIIQNTATLAVPLEELHYEYTYNIVDKELYSMDFTTDSIKIPVASPGQLIFIYGSLPVNYNLNVPGIWNITFSKDWNSIISATYVEPLPSNRIYYLINQNNNTVTSGSNFGITKQGFELPINLTVESGTSTIQVYANSTEVFNTTVTLDNGPSLLTFQVPTNDMEVGNYTIAVLLNNRSLSVGTAGITFPADLSGHFRVDYIDLATFVSDYIAYYSPNGTYTAAIDYNHDGVINFRDLALFVRYYINYYQTIG